ncbi:hypothetical protein DFH11DRAFT_1727273 [Phellopilus nigrolimitatus]|nr:hypothetical protein DFH11DRAFT_1727273 [Phellopilus nigrolimitatus]
MKRGPLADPPSTSSSVHKSKKHKTTQSSSTATLSGTEEYMNGNGDEWKSVEKRKTKHAVSAPQQGTPMSNPFSSLLQDGKQSGGEWEKVERRKAKKARKIDEKLDNTPPRFFYVNSEIVKRREAVNIGDIRDLVLHLLGEAAPQPWLKVEVFVTLFVPGILPEHLKINIQSTSATLNPNLPVSIPLPRDASAPLQTGPVVVKTLFGGSKEIVPDAPPDTSAKLPFVARTFSHACPTRAPGDSYRMHSVLGAFFQGPVSADERKRRTVASRRRRVDTKDPSVFVLTPAQMVENEYPLPSYLRDASGGREAGSSNEDGEGWAETGKPEDDETGVADVFAVDCEMCLTEDGKELTRLCVINYASGEVLLDQLVKPIKPILDYLTRWSGITEEGLRNVTTSLASARGALLDLLTASQTKTGRAPILLGHSLESDLRALKLAHGRCIDTALLYHHPRGRPLKPGLAWLTKKWCGREIQNRGDGGHDAEEDARACVELLRRKMQGGPGFGEFKTTTECESVFERLRRSIRGSASGEPGSGEGAALRTAVVDRGNPATWHGAGASRTVACATDEEVAKGVLQCIDDSDFIWARFSGLAEAQNWLQQKSATEDAKAAPPDANAIDSALKTLNAHVSIVHASLPARTAFVVFTGHADPRTMVELQARKAAFEGALRTTQAAGAGGGVGAGTVPEGVRWTMADVRALEEAVERARRGMLFLCLK